MHWEKINLPSTVSDGATFLPTPLHHTPHLSTTNQFGSSMAANSVYCVPIVDPYSHSLNIRNQHDSLLSLLEVVYPTTEASQHHSPLRRRYMCLYPHCDRLFHSLGSLRFHISKSHIVENINSKPESANPPPPRTSFPQKQQPAKRRGRPPKNASLVSYSGVLETTKTTPHLIVPYRQTNQWLAFEPPQPTPPF
ncbi:hypothetical protein [Absidia glauca]|uniref:C2H2-type domain-containing protein n=1 Tax=Absidia glauca TaxID=4829 RepID=A0A163J3B9_ABSGL|nr:hypothetical protein [Absidia glauca]